VYSHSFSRRLARHTKSTDRAFAASRFCQWRITPDRSSNNQLFFGVCAFTPHCRNNASWGNLFCRLAPRLLGLHLFGFLKGPIQNQNTCLPGKMAISRTIPKGLLKYVCKLRIVPRVNWFDNASGPDYKTCALRQGVRHNCPSSGHALESTCT
jgi:hypothetical protein